MAQSPHHTGPCWRQFCQSCARQIADCGCSGQYDPWETRRDETRGEHCIGLVGEYVPPTDEPVVPVTPGGSF